jgi:hypothetical protein
MWLISFAFAASDAAPSLPPMAWDWDAPQRLYVETEVNLPELMWFNAEFNKNARVFAFQLRAVLDCKGTEKESSRKRLVLCDVQDASLAAGAVAGDQGRMQPIVDEYDAVLTDATLALVVRFDGRITDVNLEDVPVVNLRTRGRKETLRLLMRFLAAGIEVPLPRGPDALWLSSEALLCTLPTTVGTAGPVDGVHQGAMNGGVVEIATNARGIMAPGESDNRYTCEFSAHTLFDPQVGLVHRAWTMRGEPTASSPIAMGAAGYPYLQRGSARRLTADEVVDVGESREVIPQTVGPSALQQGGSSTPPGFVQ